MKKDKRFKRICKNGHDTNIVGRTNDGHCVVCKHEYNQQYWETNQEEIVLQREDYQREYRKRNREELKKYYYDHKDELRRKQKEYDKKHKKKIARYRKKYRRAKPWIVKLSNLKHQTKRNLRIPKWGQEGILKFYKNCPKNRVVDHIIPLCGRKVSGLHVIWNLQYLTKRQNVKKANTANLMEISNKYGQLLKKLRLK
jgi:hypothetical protein